MATTRIFIRQDGVVYRFLRLEQTSDGSVIISVDRDASQSLSGKSLMDGAFVPSAERKGQITPHARWTVHTSGIVNYRHGNNAAIPSRIEPLYDLSENWLVGWVSIPCAKRLTPADARKKLGNSIVVDFPPDANNRTTFGLVVAAAPPTETDVPFVSWNYETYSIVVTPAQLPVQIDADMRQHFVYGGFGAPVESLSGISAAQAEINFHEKAHGRHVKLFRLNDGSFVVLANVEMARVPDLIVEFSRDDLSVELISTKDSKAPKHKVRFWVCDKGGRIKSEEAAAVAISHIVSIALDAELGK